MFFRCRSRTIKIFSFFDTLYWNVLYLCIRFKLTLNYGTSSKCKKASNCLCLGSGSKLVRTTIVFSVSRTRQGFLSYLFPAWLYRGDPKRRYKTINFISVSAGSDLRMSTLRPDPFECWGKKEEERYYKSRKGLSPVEFSDKLGLIIKSL